MATNNKDYRIEGIVKYAHKNAKKEVQYAYILADSKEYYVSKSTIERMEHPLEVLSEKNKVSFKAFYGKKAYANDICLISKHENSLDISNLTLNTQGFVDAMIDSIDVRKSILTCLNQPQYRNLTKEEFIERYWRIHKEQFEKNRLKEPRMLLWSWSIIIGE